MFSFQLISQMRGECSHPGLGLEEVEVAGAVVVAQPEQGDVTDGFGASGNGLTAEGATLGGAEGHGVLEH